jgi:hypothetical protein
MQGLKMGPKLGKYPDDALLAVSQGLGDYTGTPTTTPALAHSNLSPLELRRFHGRLKALQWEREGLWPLVKTQNIKDFDIRPPWRTS